MLLREAYSEIPWKQSNWRLERPINTPLHVVDGMTNLDEHECQTRPTMTMILSNSLLSLQINE